MLRYYIFIALYRKEFRFLCNDQTIALKFTHIARERRERERFLKVVTLLHNSKIKTGSDSK